MGITHGAINYQMKKIDPAAHAARAHDRARVAAETAAAEEKGHVVELVFVERGRSSSAKKALAGITQKLEGMACTQNSKRYNSCRNAPGIGDRGKGNGLTSG